MGFRRQTLYLKKLQLDVYLVHEPKLYTIQNLSPPKPLSENIKSRIFYAYAMLSIFLPEFDRQGNNRNNRVSFSISGYRYCSGYKNKFYLFRELLHVL
jgi:hypothetical protein